MFRIVFTLIMLALIILTNDARGVSDRGIGVSKGIIPSEFVKGSYGKSWAIVIGIDEYQNAPRLSYAGADAKALANLLKQLQFDVKELYNEQATRRTLYGELFDKLAEAVGEHDRVLIFFAGHGETRQLKNGKQMGFLLPVDGDPEALAETAVSMSAIRDLADSLPAKHVLFLVDVCYGGVAGQRFRGIPRMTEGYLREITRERGRQLITAGGADQPAVEGPEWGHSIFTYYLLQGLENGLADLNEDGIIPASELYQYLDQRVFTAASLKGYKQRPEFWTMAAEKGEFVFFPTPKNVTPPHKDGSTEVQRPHFPIDEAKAKDMMDRKIESGTNQPQLPSIKSERETDLMEKSSKDEPRVENPIQGPMDLLNEANPRSRESETVMDAEEYFPHSIGNQWQYRCEIREGLAGKVTKKTYRNIVSIKTEEILKGNVVKVIVDTNPGNRGQTVTLSQHNNTGIILHDWKPSEPVFKQVLPYYILKFPVEIPSTFQQFNRKGLAYGIDLDGDGKQEAAEARALTKVIGRETVKVPAGIYSDALRLDFHIMLKVYTTRSTQTFTISSVGSRWYAKNVGLVKEVRQARIPAPLKGNQEYVSDIIEELESFNLRP